MDRKVKWFATGVPEVSWIGEVEPVESVFLIKQAASELNDDDPMSEILDEPLYDIVIPEGRQVDECGRPLPADKCRIQVKGAWYADPDSDLTDLVDRAELLGRQYAARSDDWNDIFGL
ncbi:MAG TPA: hypothetical protein VF572_00155 [Candidatus Saccharimonadales bacterium]